MFTQDINFFAIITTAILNFLIGWLWYSPYLFGNAWLEVTRFNKDELRASPAHLLGAFAIALIVSFVTALFVYATNATTALEGALVGWWAWLGYIATTHFSGVLWERKPFKLYLINVSAKLLILVLTGAILAVWR